MSGTPDTLEISVGGFPGSYYRVEWSAGVLRYSVGVGPNTDVTALQPDADDWNRFRRALEGIDIWSWRADYDASMVCDGTQWSVDIHWGDRSVRSRGSNCYPGPDGSPIELDASQERFQGLLVAARRLIGGRKFY